MKLKEFARESKEIFVGDKKNIPIVGLEHLNSNELLFSNYDLNTENTFTKRFTKGHVLFGRRRAYLKKAAFAEFDGICSGDITVIEAIPGKVLAELLPFIIQNDKLFDFAISRSAGGLSPRVKWKDLAEFEFDLPPLKEQKKLADKLWAAYRLKESYKKLLASMDELVKSQFMERFIISKSWPAVTLAEAFTLQMGKTPSRDVPEYWQSPDYRWISIADLSSYDKFTGDTKEKISQKAVDSTGIKPVPKGTVIMSFKLTIGQTAIASDDIFTNEAIMAFLPKRTDIDPEFLRLYLSIKNWSDNAKQAVKGVTLNKQSIGSAEIVIPPIDDQRKFASLVQQLDKSKLELQKSIAAIDNVIKSLIN